MIRVNKILNKTKFGQNVAKYREAQGKTQEELGVIVGYSGSMMGQVERGEKGASLNKAAIIANALGIGLDVLLDGCMEEGR